MTPTHTAEPVPFGWTGTRSHALEWRTFLSGERRPPGIEFGPDFARNMRQPGWRLWRTGRAEATLNPAVANYPKRCGDSAALTQSRRVSLGFAVGEFCARRSARL